ncbi:MAG TPA: hypothetical protein VJT67_03625 [Longimicrobiaceae bacterium]|nr:hypothetical protein [Longimicrobiaceae bacterium]
MAGDVTTLRQRSFGLDALGGFFAFGAGASGLSVVTLLWPGGPLDVLWGVNPDGHAAMLRARGWAVLLMLVVCAACAATAGGLWARRPWARTLAIAVLAVNLLSDLANAVVRGDARTLIGLPIAALLIAYLLAPRTRAAFPHREAE